MFPELLLYYIFSPFPVATVRVLPRVVQGFLVGENDIIFFDLMKVVILFVPKSNLFMVPQKK